MLSHPPALPQLRYFLMKLTQTCDLQFGNHITHIVIVVSGHSIEKPTYAKSCELPTVWVDRDFMLCLGRR